MEKLYFLKVQCILSIYGKLGFLKLSFAFETFILKNVFSVFLVDER